MTNFNLQLIREYIRLGDNCDKIQSKFLVCIHSSLLTILYTSTFILYTIYFGSLQVRIGIPFIHILGMEKVMYKYGVDLMFWAHEHSYERLWPVYDRKVRTILGYTFLLNRSHGICHVRKFLNQTLLIYPLYIILIVNSKHDMVW